MKVNNFTSRYEHLVQLRENLDVKKILAITAVVTTATTLLFSLAKATAVTRMIDRMSKKLKKKDGCIRQGDFLEQGNDKLRLHIDELEIEIEQAQFESERSEKQEQRTRYLELSNYLESRIDNLLDKFIELRLSLEQDEAKLVRLVNNRLKFS